MTQRTTHGRCRLDNLRGAMEPRTNTGQNTLGVPPFFPPGKGGGFTGHGISRWSFRAVFSGIRLAVSLYFLATYNIWGTKKPCSPFPAGRVRKNRWVLLFTLRYSSPHRSRTKRISDDHSGTSRVRCKSTFRYNPSTGSSSDLDIDVDGASSSKCVQIKEVCRPWQQKSKRIFKVRAKSVSPAISITRSISQPGCDNGVLLKNSGGVHFGVTSGCRATGPVAGDPVATRPVTQFRFPRHHDSRWLPARVRIHDLDLPHKIDSPP